MSVNVAVARSACFAALVARLDGLAVLTRYGVTGDKLLRMLMAANERKELILVACAPGDTDPCGLAWGMARGAFASAGYLRLLLVARDAWGTGVGTALLRAFESHCERPSGGFFALTEDGAGVAPFYQSCGYAVVGPLPSFVQRGRTELLLWKST